MSKSFAQGNGPNGTGLVGSKPPEASAASVTFWELVHGTDPRNV